MKTIYPTKFKYKRDVRILLWKEGEDHEDRFLLGKDNKLIRGVTIEELRGLPDQSCNSDSVDWPYDYTVDMDAFTEALLELIPGQEVPTNTCHLLIDGWNFIDDLLHTMDMPRTYEEQHTDDINYIYDRLFWGLNLPPLTPPGESWHPVFVKDEILSVQELFISILARLEQEQVI